MFGHRIARIGIAGTLLFGGVAAALPSITADAAAPAAHVKTLPAKAKHVAPAKAKHVAPTTVQHVTYRVRRGDSLWLVARRYHTTVGRLVALNAAKHPSLRTHPNRISVGWVLVVR